MKKIILFAIVLSMLGLNFAKESEKVPNFLLNSLSGQVVSLDSYTANKDVSFLVFFTSWCPWCTKQLETFQEMSKETSAKVQYVAIGFDNDKKKVIGKINSIGVTFPVVMGTSEISEYFKVSGIPVTVVVDKKGKVIDQVVGFRDKKYFSKFIN